MAAGRQEYEHLPRSPERFAPYANDLVRAEANTHISSVRYRRAMMLLASAGGNRVPVIAQLVHADEDTARDVIHQFNEIGLACLDPQWAGGRPRLPLGIRPTAGSCWAKQGRPDRLPATFRRTHGVTCFHRRHPDVLAAQRKERTRIRSEKGIRWGGRPLAIAA
ncbi:helix-turn-helix domain-containing protein [Streptomyces sp. NPDC090445]|uniref:helix-turn-helix domain-containing protein n=1 Tax=Streptomyces sp. NPDC090445 TaxID=3365963 RepID=UPI0037F122E4